MEHLSPDFALLCHNLRGTNENAHVLRIRDTMCMGRRPCSICQPGRHAAEDPMERFDAIRHNGFSAVSAASDAAMQHALCDSSAGQASRAPMDIVYIEGFTGQTVIGIDHGELHAPQPVRMSLAIGVPAIRGCTTDRIEDTINYAAVREALHGLLASHGTQLLEALAEKVAQLLIADFGAHWVRVSLAKPAKFDDVESVGVLIERRRDETRAVYATCASLGEGLIPN